MAITKPTSRGARIAHAESAYEKLRNAHRLIGDPAMKEPLDYVVLVLAEIRFAAISAQDFDTPKEVLLERIWEQLIKPTEKGTKP